MEQARAQAKVDELKNQFELVDDAHLAKMYSEAKRDIEHHFDDLFNSILERKEALLQSLETSFAFLKRKVIEEQTQLKSKLEMATKALELGVSMLQMSKDAAHSFFKTIDLITHPQQEFKLHTIFPSNSLLHNIKIHGSVFSQPLQYNTSSVSTLAGSSKGCVDGIGELAKFNQPVGVVLSPDDNCLYVCDDGNDMIRKVTLFGEVNEFCKVSRPSDIVYNRQQQLFYVSSYFGHTIHQITYEAGKISLFAGVDGKSGDLMV